MTAPVTQEPPSAVRPKRKDAKSSAGGSRLGRYILVRLLLIIPTVFILVSIVFLLMHLIGDPISAALGGRLSPDQLQARIHAAMGGIDGRLVHILVDAQLDQRHLERQRREMQGEGARLPAQCPGDKGMGVFMCKEDDGVRQPPLPQDHCQQMQPGPAQGHGGLFEWSRATRARAGAR